MARLTRRTFLGGALSVSALAATAGCSGFSGGGGAAGGGGSAVSLLLVDQASTKELQSTLLPQFSSQSGVQVNVELVPESGLDAKLATSLASGAGQYDVVMAGAKNWSTLVASGWIEPLDDQLAKGTDPGYLEGFPQQLLDTIKVDDQQYAMPYQVGADLLYYNKRLFSKAGLDPDRPPSTLDEVVTAAKQLQERSGESAFVGRGSREGNENSFLWLMMWFLNGGRWQDAAGQDDFSGLTKEPALKATQQYEQLLTTYAPRGVSNYGFAEAQLAMQQGKAAMWLDAAQLGPSLEDKTSSTIAGDVGYKALTGTGDDYIVGAVWGFCMVKGTRVAADAWKLIQYLTSKEVGVKQAVSGTNGSPGRSDVLDDASVKQALNPDFLAALQEAIAHTNPRYTPFVAQGTQMRGAIALQLSRLLTGDVSAAEAMSTADADIQKLLR